MLRKVNEELYSGKCKSPKKTFFTGVTNAQLFDHIFAKKQLSDKTINCFIGKGIRNQLFMEDVANKIGHLFAKANLTTY